MSDDNTIQLYKCPCCDFYTLDARCDWDICPICFWEDDLLVVTTSDLDRESPANRMTLRQGRDNFAKFGACEEAMLEHVLPKSEWAQFKREE